MQHNVHKFFILYFWFISGVSALSAQDVMLQGWYWDYPQFVAGKSHAVRLKNMAEALNEAGFTHVWVPPMSAASFGSSSVGYDVRDYYDLGNFAGRTRFGNRSEVDELIQVFSNYGIKTVADVIYNHRDGGAPEDNPAVEGWIENMTSIKIDAGDQPFPSDRYQCYLPLGSATGNGTGSYYFKIRSASEHPNFFGKKYTVMMWTNTVAPNYGSTPLNESEPNGGGDCGEGFNALELGKRMIAFIDNSSCKTDEFKLDLSSSDFNASGDTLWIRMYNEGGLGDMSDHYIYGVWNSSLSTDVQAQIGYQTYTDYQGMPSGRGGMDWQNFKPNGNPTQLSGDIDAMLFFYDIDHSVQSTRDSLFEYTRWMIEDVGVEGIRIDAVKHFESSFVGDLLDHLFDQNASPGLVVGESFDFNASTLKGWTDAVQASMDGDTKAAIDVRVFDFALRNNLEQACDGFGYDVRNLFNSSIVDGAGGSGFNVVTFVNNHDFRYPGQPVDNDPVLAYAYILTNNQLGIPTVFYPDYFAPGNLKLPIDGLIKVHRDYLFGADQVDHLNRFGTPYSSNYISGFDHTSLIYQISNGIAGREVVVAINFAGETLRVDHQLNPGNLSSGDTLTDIFTVSQNPYALLSTSGEIYMEIPARSFGVWIEGNLTNNTILIEDTTGTSLNDPVMGRPGDFLVHPNPSSSGYRLQFPSTVTGRLEYTITAADGTRVRNGSFLPGINGALSDLEALDVPGIYYISVRSPSHTSTKKLIQLR